VRVVGAEGEQLGVLVTRDAIKMAETEGLDLVEISSTARPPVCRIMDLGKFKYEQARSLRKARKKQQGTTLKEMRYRPKIDRHDVEFKTKHVRQFLENGHKVKVYVEFRGREMTHTEYGVKILSQIEELLEEVGTVENRPKMEGRHMTMLMVPKRALVPTKKKAAPAPAPTGAPVAASAEAVKEQPEAPAGE
jgi:translation initiation factor IF-3